MIIGWMLPQGRLALIHGTPRRDERIDELAEVIIMAVDTQVHEVVLDDESFRFVVGSYKNAVV